MCQFQTHIVIKKKRRRRRSSKSSSSSRRRRRRPNLNHDARLVVYSPKNLLQVFLGEEDDDDTRTMREKQPAQNETTRRTTRTRTTRTIYHRVFHRSKRPGFDKLCSIPLHFINVVNVVMLKEREREREREREERRRKKAVKKEKKSKNREKQNKKKGRQAELRTNISSVFCFDGARISFDRAHA